MAAGSDYETVTIEVREGIFRLIGYKWEDDGEEVTLRLRYEGEEIEPFKILSPLLTGCESRVRDLVEVMVGWLYQSSVDS